MSSQARCCEERGDNETRTMFYSLARHQEVTEKSSLLTLHRKQGNVRKLMQTQFGVCEMSTPGMRVRTLWRSGGSGNRKIVLLNDNHTVILLLFGL